MDRKQIGNGQWFDADSAVVFKENSIFDGRNRISVNSGSQWEHETLYYTKSGKWVLNSWSDYQGTIETYRIFGASSAVRWLVINEATEEELSLLPEGVRLEVVGLTAKLEI